MTWEDRGLLLAHLLNACAKYIESGSIMNADLGLARISHLASPDGDSMQRVATYFSEALSYQVINKNFRGARDVLSKPFSTSEELLVKKLFFDLYPFLRISYAITNQAIIEAMEGLEAIHILDLSASHDATQWILLMRSLEERSARPPYLKITCVHAKQELLDQMRLHLRVEAEKLNFSLEFNAIVSTLENLDLEKLRIQKGEPLAISIVLQLHSLLAIDDPIPMVNPPSASMHQQQTFEEVLLGKQKMVINASPDSALSPAPSLSPLPKMECFLYGLWKLQPKVMVITEQESNVNGPTLTDRVDKALHFYASLFDCLESTISKTLVERILLERMLLGEQIRNIIACEGAQRKERHEKLKTWIPRLELAGFRGVSISFDGMLHASKQLQSYGHGYKIIRENKCLLICWNDKPLFSLSAWKF